jgi:hypothetical protein
MMFRARRAADVAGDVYLASLPTRLDQRPEGWRSRLSEERMRAALSAALDLPPDEHLEIAKAVSRTELRGGGVAYYRDILDAVLAALKAHALGVNKP